MDGLEIDLQPKNIEIQQNQFRFDTCVTPAAQTPAPSP